MTDYSGPNCPVTVPFIRDKRNSFLSCYINGLLSGELQELHLYFGSLFQNITFGPPPTGSTNDLPVVLGLLSGHLLHGTFFTTHHMPSSKTALFSPVLLTISY